MIDEGVDVDGVLVPWREPIRALPRERGWLLVVHDPWALQPHHALPQEVLTAAASGPAGQVLLGGSPVAEPPRVPADRGGDLTDRVSVLTDRVGVLGALGQALARLRRDGVLDPAADVAVRTPAAGPAQGRLAQLLPFWRARAVSLGEVLADAGPVAVPVPGPVPRRHLVTGPTASGKSRWAELCVLAEPDVTYLATAALPEAGDSEWAARIAAHRSRRPPWWATVETSQVGPALLGAAGSAVLWDSVGSWLTGVLDRCGAWEGSSGWRAAWEGEAEALLDTWQRPGPRTVVAVTEEVGWGVVPPTRSGRLFADLLGALNQRLADASESVTLVVAGRTVALS